MTKHMCQCFVRTKRHRLHNRNIPSRNTNLFVAFWSIPISFMISFIFEYEYLSYYFNFFMLWTSFGNGFFMAISFLLMTRSLEKVSCNKTSYMAYIQLPLITLFGLVFFNERVTFVEFIGGLVIVSSIVITTQFYIDYPCVS